MVALSLLAAVSAASVLTSGANAQTANSDSDHLVDPRRAHSPSFTLPEPYTFPGLMTDIEPQPDCGENSYVGNGRMRGRRALITGGDSGIGRTAAIAWAREGAAAVTINYLPGEQSDAESLRDVIESTSNASIYLMPGNLRNESFCSQLVENAAERMGGLDLLFNNAGTGAAFVNFTDLTTEEFMRTAETNIFAPFWLSRAAAPLMPPGSDILFTSSAMAPTPAPNLAHYAASKAWIRAFSNAIAQILMADGIKVNSIAPPLVLTPLVSTQGLSAEQAQMAAASQAVGRIAQPVELAPLLVSIVENAATYTYGVWWGWAA
jgi:NAD(P)-dependent dehydrogenase (short-subunit alcohol dehydrogenase family)